MAATPASTVSIPEAVNLAGRERMLSQRMAKAYLMRGQGIAARDAETILADSLAVFEAQLARLQAGMPNAEIARSLAALDTEWRRMKPLLVVAPTPSAAAALYDANEAVQTAAHHLTLAYERESAQPLDHLINLAGRQRMLSQRLAKFYFYRTWELSADAAAMEMHLSRAHFTSVLRQLEVSSLLGAPVKQALATLREAWAPYEALLMADAGLVSLRTNATRVAELSEQVLEATEQVVAALNAQRESSNR
ncbi:MAG: type IV pili methyl-accepting chemotaxis transducer N-terminal domain-containing protein [Proteobacteria bacterium]|nr:type IV pili methyl-accepting chemotaxis transducer N-terminal domain-containing protein [Pseudomonadota bacterium]